MFGLNITVAIYRASKSQNDMGELIKSWAVSTASAKARRTTVSAKEQESLQAVAGGEATVAESRWFFEAGTDVQLGDRIKYSGSYEKVVGVSDVDEMGHHIEALAVRIEGVTE